MAPDGRSEPHGGLLGVPDGGGLRPGGFDARPGVVDRDAVAVDVDAVSAVRLDLRGGSGQVVASTAQEAKSVPSGEDEE
ncbi:hypothetical protein ABZY45_27355 [Streptomyces sp. NPDC006516]|uniref:hypothetical protein n=1 Tax=Streptomyces sp. NPDC006516 TaxID=3154309 RepID=UPI0033B92EEF